MSHITWQNMSDMSKQMCFHMFHVLFILAPFGPHHGPQTVCVVSDSEPPEVPWSTDVLTSRGACRSTPSPSPSHSLQHSRHGCILVTRLVTASTAATPSRDHVLNQRLRAPFRKELSVMALINHGETIVPMDPNLQGTTHPHMPFATAVQSSLEPCPLKLRMCKCLSGSLFNQSRKPTDWFYKQYPFCPTNAAIPCPWDSTLIDYDVIKTSSSGTLLK